MQTNNSIDWEGLDYPEFLHLVDDEERAFAFCIRSGLIDQEQECECGRSMRLRVNKQKRFGLQFICNGPRSSCGKTKSVLKNSFFSHSRLPLSKALGCIACYAANLSNKQLCFFVGLGSDHTATNWRNHFRSACSSIILQQAEHKIGGVGLTVEIDETLLFKRKNNVGRLLANEDQGIWFFGGICRENDDAFILQVSNRDAITLRNALERNVQPGTRVISDCWRGYSSLSQFGWDHRSVNHSQNFVNPDEPDIHTQKIERMWKTLKRTIPKECNSSLRWSYVHEFVFKQRFKWYSLSIGERIHLILTKLKDISFY
jgi:hypothetical protein